MTTTRKTGDFAALVRHANKVSREAWGAMDGQHAMGVVILIGTLMAAIEAETGWTREQLIDHICEVADSCAVDTSVQ